MTVTGEVMLDKYIFALAKQMGVKLSKIVIVDGKEVGVLDVHLLKLTAKGQTVHVLVYQADIVCLEKRKPCDRLDSRVRTALERLQVAIQP